MKKLAITSMYANPIHPGHIECLDLSKQHSDELWVIVNNDLQAKLKRGYESFQDQESRANVVGAIKSVDKTFISIDKDGSVCESLEKLINEALEKKEFSEIIFTKGGDRFANEIPEKIICEKYGVKIVDGLGKKTHSSSDLINKASNKNDIEDIKRNLESVPKEHLENRYLEIGKRPWGIYYVLEDSPQYKVKKIIVNPGKRLSLQSHEKRSEHWIVVSGVASVDIRNPKFAEVEQIKVLERDESCNIPQGHLHRLSNNQETPLILIEVQSGSYFGEDDIKRYEDDFGRTK